MTERCVRSDALLEAESDLRRSGWRLATIAVSDPEIPELRYVFCGPRDQGWRQLIVRSQDDARIFPSLASNNAAADWLERELGSSFAIDFAGHPRPGGLAPSDLPLRAVNEDGAFVMPVGPVYSGRAESALFLLESVGEHVVRAEPHLFYKHRGIEKLARGRSAEDAMLLVERANGTSAFAHAWAYCMAAEHIYGIELPARATHLRTLLAEIERIRRHVAVLRETVEATGMLVAAAQLFELEEWLLRTCGEMTGHRYLFGLACIGGLQRNIADAAVYAAVGEISAIAKNALDTMTLLESTSSFLDRVEDIGIFCERHALELGAAGPFARASNAVRDLRVEQPYGSYATSALRVPSAHEGDGYARLRVLCSETRASLDVISELASQLPAGAVRTACPARAGEALGWAEAPAGASVILLQLDESGRCVNLRFTPASFRNWQCFGMVAENFTFQDFSVILATCGLSVAEADR